MNTTQQAYIEGFVKRAGEYGFSEIEAIDLLKNAAEQAPYNGVKTLGEMWNEFKTGKPTMATKLPVSTGTPSINPALATK
jgi:hypothetical protein